LTERAERFAFIKTFHSRFVEPDDLDLITTETGYEELESSLADGQQEYVKNHTFHEASEVKIDGLKEFDLHSEISWLEYEPLSIGSSTFDYNNMEFEVLSVDEFDIRVPIARHAAAIILAHDLSQHHYTTFTDFLSVAKLCAESETDIKQYFEDQRLATKYLAWLRARSFLLLGEQLHLDNGDYMVGERLLHTGPLFYHPFSWIPTYNTLQAIDFASTVYRKYRYLLTGKLPYHV
jgi:hypothetical protein